MIGNHGTPTIQFIELACDYAVRTLSESSNIQAGRFGRIEFRPQLINRCRLSKQYPPEYDQLGLEKIKQLANGVTITREWDEIGRDKTATFSKAGTVFAQYSATYPEPVVDSVKYQQQVVTETVTGASTVSTTYTFDKLYRLARETRTGSNAYDIQYEYDAAGNRTTKVEGGQTTSYLYDAGNQLTSWSVGDADPEQTASYSYDENGNVVATDVLGTETTFEWNEENELSQWQKVLDEGSETETFEYDGLGLRREKTVVTDESISFRYVWDGSNVLQERLASDGSRLAHYTDYPGAWGGMTSQRRGSESTFYASDFAGNTRFLMDSSGGVTDTMLTTAFGKRVDRTGSTENVYGFGSETGYQDEGEDRFYVRARVYDCDAGRWLSMDPLGFGGGDVNLYAYCGGNPVGGSDPSGMEPRTIRTAGAAKWRTMIRGAAGTMSARGCTMRRRGPG